MKKTLTAIAIACMVSPALRADDGAPKLQIKPTGRILMDAAAYIGGNNEYREDDDTDRKFVSGVGIPDLRVGMKATYGKWFAKIDVGYAYGKVGLKDTYIEYNFNADNVVRGGYFCPQFGLNSETSSSMKPEYEEPSSNEFFQGNPRVLALMWRYDKGHFFQATSLICESGAMKQTANDLGKEAWGAQTRHVYRTKDAGSDVLQAGCSFLYRTPDVNDHDGFEFSANFPSRVSKITLLSAPVDHAKGLFKLSPEVLLLKNRFAFEGQYYFLNVSRKYGLNSYQAHGAYAMTRFILLGNPYRYKHSEGGMATPDSHTLELVAGYNWTKANDMKADIRGGISNDANITLNYYLNPYMIARLRYSYTNVRDRWITGLLPDRHVNTIEARLQIIF